MRHRDIQLLKKIISECNDIARYTSQAGKQEFLANDIYQKAIAMSLLNIGEHANALTRELWAEHTSVQWRKIVDLRNIVAHGYGELRMELVWNLSQNEVPALMVQIKEVLTEIDPS
jgi:uncharacterized protein with HEPN domain